MFYLGAINHCTGAKHCTQNSPLVGFGPFSPTVQVFVIAKKIRRIEWV